MMVKVNQISSIAQAMRLKNRIDIGGICISRVDNPKPPYIGIDLAVEIRKTIPELRLSLTFCVDDSFSESEISDLLEKIDASYFEFTPIDYAKQELFEKQMKTISNIQKPKIANGFYIQRDDCNFISATDPFRLMRDAGVELFQFEVDSAVDPSFRIKPKDLANAEKFFAEFSSLVSDNINRIQNYPLKSIAGFFFNISAAEEARNCDYSLRSWSESAIIRILMSG